jgi:hypothetical protein
MPSRSKNTGNHKTYGHKQTVSILEDYSAGAASVRSITWRLPLKSEAGFSRNLRWVVHWYAVCPHSKVLFAWNKPSWEPMCNLEPPYGNIDPEVLGWCRENPGQQWVLGGDAGALRGELTDEDQMALVETAKNNPACTHIDYSIVGSPIMHKGENNCALNAYCSLIKITSEQKQKITETLGPSGLWLSIKHLSKHINTRIHRQHAPYRLRHTNSAHPMGKSSSEKIDWLLARTTGLYLVGASNHVIGWDANTGAIYDPGEDITRVLPATHNTVVALRLIDIKHIRELEKNNKKAKVRGVQAI